MACPYDKAETFLMLKYGSIPLAYKAYMNMSLSDQIAFDTRQYEIIMEYEYNMQINGPGPFEPR